MAVNSYMHSLQITQPEKPKDSE